MTIVDIVDPPAYSPPYDHGLAAALAARGATVRLVTSQFAFGPVPDATNYSRLEHFYRHAQGAAGSRSRTATKALEHVPDMFSYRRLASSRDIVHFQWLTLPLLDLRLLPKRPTVLTLHDPPGGGATNWPRALRHGLGNVDALIVHTRAAKAWLTQNLNLDPDTVNVIPHGALTHLDKLQPTPPPELPPTDRPVVLCFGLIRPYKGIETLLEAWDGITDAELQIVGRPMSDISALALPPNARLLPRFITDAEQKALFDRADLIVAPYLQSGRFGFSGVLATALAAGKPILTTDVSGFDDLVAEGAAQAVPSNDPDALRSALRQLIGDPNARAQLAAAAARAAASTYSWDAAAAKTLALYARITG